jgi:RimJ/RimL family protein N-acetyltransferase
MQMPPFLTHANARCSLIVPGHAHIPLALRLQNEPESRQYLGRVMPIGEKQEAEWAERANTSANDAVFVIALKDKKRTPIGTMGLHRIDWVNRRATTGSVMLEDHCGKGFGSDAKMLLLNWAFNELGLRKIESRVLAFNGRSQAYSEKCGYKEVARLREHTLRRGAYHDEVILEVYVEEWRKLWEKFEAGTFCKKETGAGQTSHNIAWKLEGDE